MSVSFVMSLSNVYEELPICLKLLLHSSVIFTESTTQSFIEKFYIFIVNIIFLDNS